MTEVAGDIAFIIPGQLAPMPATSDDTARGVVRTSVRVGTPRAGAAAVRVVARPGRDVVVLVVANGPTLVLHPHDARDLLLAQAGAPAPAARGTSPDAGEGKGDGERVGERENQGDTAPATGEVAVPSQLGWPGLEAQATRSAAAGWMGQAVLTGFHVLTGLTLARNPAVTLATAAVTRKVDGLVDGGVYRLSADALGPLKGSGTKLDQVPAAADGGPLLLFVHGTFSDTPGTFGKLWTMHNPVVRRLFARYGERVYGFDHPTLGVSPIGNALALLRALPDGARIHLLTHSRGGLVADVLARVCGGGPLTEDVLALFAGKGHARHRRDLLALAEAARAKGLRIERVVRVACPARGTLLASKRLDAYLSVVSWCLQLAGIPVAPALLDFLHEVARRRSDPAELPGLESMLPTSPLVAWLNAAPEPIAGDLRVVAGDMQGDSIGSWVKTLLADAFYWTDNDLVVQTRSMYGGTPRLTGADRGGASFLLDAGGKVSHFNYFGNHRTVQAIADALTSDRPAEFATIGPLSWAGRDTSGARAAPAAGPAPGTASRPAPASRPAVFLIPGLLASNLARDGRRIWLGYRLVADFDALRWSRAGARRVMPDGPVDAVYDRLAAQLAVDHDLTVFAFDWRRPIEDEARRLADAVDAALTARRASGQPVRLLAHSTGGLLARTMALERPKTWRRLLARDGARVVLLGTPNGGSWSPMQTLSGDETFGNALIASGPLLDGVGARATMATMPGFLQVQAGLLDATRRLDRAETWQALADADLAQLGAPGSWHLEDVQRALYAWGVPTQAVLDQAVALRRRLDAGAIEFGADPGKIAMVVGRSPATPTGYTVGANGLEYLDAAGGDGRVALADALLPGVPAWVLDAPHGELASRVDAFPAYLELLATGATHRLEPLAGPPGSIERPGLSSADATAPVHASSVPSLSPSRPSRGLLLARPPSSAADVFGVAVRPAGDDRRTDAALHVTVLNGDLRFVHQPLMVGHYRSLLLTGTEAIVDRLVGGAMSRSLSAGLYPGPAGSHQVFGNIRRDPDNVLAMARPLAVVVAGLGEEGKLRALDLSYTVRQAVLAYAQRLAEQEHGAPAEFEIATTLMGSGGTGISAGSAAQLIAQGVFDASAKLREKGWPQVGRLILVEIYLDRASDAWRALEVQSTATRQLQVVGPVLAGAGALRRSLDSSYRGAAYDFITALTSQRADGEPTITYTLDTRRARTEVRAQQAQGTLVRDLVARASNDNNRDAQIGRTLFDLLVPVEMEPFLGGTTEMVIELDAGTAAIPWELLDTPGAQDAGGDRRPWAIRSKLLRKLRTADFRAQPSDAAADGSVLVIGAPLVDAALYPPLPGALAEAHAVVARLTAGAAGLDAAHVRALVSGSDDARSVINALFERPYRVVHVAGHGAPGARGGVVLSGDSYLGPSEVAAMRTVPELVFLNCCHLAARDPQTTLVPYDRAGFAANIAEALIEIGVRCVVAAGWAVEDEPAALFATTFYDALLGGERFIDAVAAGRAAAWRANPDGNTWAAYQCYGDPAWTWHRDGSGVARAALSLQEEFAAVSSAPALALALETISIRLRFGGDGSKGDASRQGQRDRIRYLEASFAPLWGGMGAVAEAFGLAFADARDLDKAVAWYRTAVAADDGSASFRAAEQLGNQLARRGEAAADAGAGRRDIEEGIALLSALVAMQTTAERESLLGSAWKRLVLLEGHGDGPASVGALRAMARHYGNAERLARASDADDLFYPAKNGMSADLRLAFLERRPAELALERIEAVRASLERAATERPDFWVVVGQIELRLLGTLALGQLAADAGALIRDFESLKARVPAPGMWDSVHVDARFTLEPYLAVAGAAEKKAAMQLLDALAALASP